MVSERLQRRIEHLLDEAEEAITKLDWKVVHDRAQAVLAIDPENGDGLALALIAVQRRDVMAASELYGALQPIVGPGLPKAILALAALALLSTASWASCHRPWATLTKQQPTSRTPWLSAARRDSGPCLPGPAAITRTPFVRKTAKVIGPKPRPCWTSPWPFPASWACGR